MGPMIEAINKRISVRTYIDKPIEEKEKKIILGLLRSDTRGPFGNRMRFELVDFTELDKKEVRTLGTYGIIKGAKLFIVGVTTASDKTMEDFGYCLEKVILKATNLGFGTCWMGGTFKRSGFAKRMNVKNDEIVPVICPIGYARENRAITDKVFRFVAKSDKRKQWDELFFNGNINAPLDKDKANRYAIALESVRIAPSASNKQPWRIIKEIGKDAYHFYLKRTKGYANFIKEFKIQNIDLGIAMCHFELSAIEMGLRGQWKDEHPHLDVEDMEYVVSWEE